MLEIDTKGGRTRKMERKNWTQELRKRTLKEVAKLMKEHGGYSKIVTEGSMSDFEKYISVQIGCSIKAAQDYIETLRGAALFYQKTKPKSGDEMQRTYLNA